MANINPGLKSQRFTIFRAPLTTIESIAFECLKQIAIEAKARSLGKPLHEFLIDCVYVGFNEIMHEGCGE